MRIIFQHSLRTNRFAVYRPIPRATRRKKERNENTKNSKRLGVCARVTDSSVQKETDGQRGKGHGGKRRKDESRPFEGGLRGHGGVCRPRVNLDEEKQRGSEEEGKGGESPLADYVPSPPRSFTPAMFFLLLPFLPRPPMISPTIPYRLYPTSRF